MAQAMQHVSFVKAFDACVGHAIPDEELTVGGGKLKIYSEGKNFRWCFYPDSGVKDAPLYGEGVTSNFDAAKRAGLEYAKRKR